MSPYLGGRNKALQALQLLFKIRQLADHAEKLLEAENWHTYEVLKRLKAVLYKMEDVLEEVDMSIRDEQRIHGGKLTKPLCTMASKPGRIITKSKLATQLKACIEELGDVSDEAYPIIGDNNIFAQQGYQFQPLHVPHPAAEWDTIIGRDEDKQAIIQLLLSDSNHLGVSVDETQAVDVVSIVGFGGVGKTTLANLVYSDSTVAANFDLRCWICMGAFGGIQLWTIKLLKSVLYSAGVDSRTLSLDLLVQQFRDIIAGKKLLLVLDDVWSEDPSSWSLLLDVLSVAKHGSKILVTTRSKGAAHALRSHPAVVYELNCLTSLKAWLLFKRHAFKDGQEEMNPSFTEIGKQIVKLCHHIPLPIRIVSSILRDKTTLEEWEVVFNNIQGTTSLDSIMPILRLSYIHLPQQLKRCFAYCSLFPMDYQYNKSDLIYLWMAQGYIKPLNGNHQILEEAGNEYIMCLLSRCIFQDAALDESGEVISFKMHDLLHDVALEIAEDTFVAEGEHYNVPNSSVIHLSFHIDSEWEAPFWLPASKQLRSLLLFPDYSAGSSITIHDMDKLFSSLRRLRALVLYKADCKHLPNSIRYLKHLRYLKLDGSFESLPPSIIRLHYLQTLELQACAQYVKFPKGVTNIDGVKVLCNLQHFKFVVDENVGLRELVNSLNEPVGKLEINFKTRHAKSLEARHAILKNKHVKDMVFEWSSSYGEPDSLDDEDKLLQKLEPSQSVETLVVRFWKGMRITSWGMLDLVSLGIEGCSKCQELPPFHKLPSLRRLYLINLKSLEYIENSHDSIGAPSASYFTSLEALKLEELPKLKGWCRVKGNAEGLEHGSQQNLPSQLSFPCLSDLTIYLCPKLMWLPQAPKLQTCSLEEIPAQLVKQFTLPVSSTLDQLEIVSIFQLESLSINNSPHKCLRIKRCEKLVDLISTSPTFQQLEISSCVKLRNIAGGLQHVEELKIWLCEELNLWINTGNDNIGVDHVVTSGSSVESLDWKDLKGLRLLTIGSISKLESLPKGLNYLMELQELKLFQLRNLRSLPKWISGLTQLRILEIVGCPMMRKLFDEPDFFTIHLESLTIKVERCRELLVLFEGNPVSFQRLEVHRCAKLNSISSAELEIKELVASCCDELHLWEDDQGGSVGANMRTTVVQAWLGLKSVNTLPLDRISRPVSSPKGLCYLTSLQQLEIFQLQIEVLQMKINYLTQLHRLEIVDCPKLKTMSLVSNIEVGEEEPGAGVHQKHLFEFLRIDNCPELLSMTVVYPITIQNCELHHCLGMKEISGEDLVIQKLVVENCNALDFWNDGADDPDITITLPAACQVLNSVQSLTLSNISKLETLPWDLQSNKALKDLEIIKLRNLRTLPGWVNQFAQLERLDIRECPKLMALTPSLAQLTKLQCLLIRGCSLELESRCQQINGEDWPYIQHIPEVIVA